LKGAVQLKLGFFVLVKIAPDALRSLVADPRPKVKALLLRTGKVEASSITVSARGNRSSGGRVYMRLE